MQCDGMMPTILRKGGLVLKAIVVGNEGNTVKLEMLGRSVLGIPYEAETDTMAIGFNVYLGQKKRGVKVEGDLTMDCLATKVPRDVLIPRILLGIVNWAWFHLSLLG